MKNQLLREKFWPKVMAFLLFVLLVLVAIGGIGGRVYAEQEGWYSGKQQSFATTGICRNLVYDDMYQLMRLNRESSVPVEELADAFGSSSNFLFIIYGVDGEVLADTASEHDAEFVMSYEFAYWWAPTTGNSTFTTDNVVTEAAQTIRVEGYLRSFLLKGDHYYSSAKLVNTLYNMRNAFVWIAAAALICALFVFIFLMRAAGHHEDKDGITPCWQDHLPLDIYLLLVGLFFFVGIDAISYMSADSYFLVVFLAICLIAFSVSVLLGLCMTIAVRIKMGKWWRNTLIYIIGRAVYRGISSFFNALPVIWKTIVACIALFFINLFLYVCINNGQAMGSLIFFLADCAILYLFFRATWEWQQLRKVGKALSEGDLEQPIDTSKLHYEFKKHGDDLNNISLGMARAVEDRMRSERLKTELITNVSHDIKTPLTSIISYVELLKKELPANEKTDEYIAVLERQSKRLKKLTEDVVEASKATTGNIAVNLERTNVRELLGQVLAEYEERLAEQGLVPILNHQEAECFIMADSRLMWRVFDNLLGNICKYAMPQTRVYFDVKQALGRVEVSIKNISSEELNISADELMERFVRGDASRNSEGSGLGLSIAQSLIELQGGTFTLAIDGDMFKVKLACEQC